MVLERLHVDQVSSPFWQARFDPVPDEMLGVLDSSLPAVNLTALADPEIEELLLECVAGSVEAARYWQDPDEQDIGLADPRLEVALAPVAKLIAAAPAAKWWSDPVNPSKQVYVEKREDGLIRPPVFRGAQVVLGAWRNETTGPGTRHWGQWVGGPWWSTPVCPFTAEDLKRYGEPLPRVAQTTRSRPGLGAVELLLEEDTFGTPAALCWPVRARAPVRIFEIDNPDHWMELVERYGIDVTGKRIAHWPMATGVDCRWVIPDWLAVAEDYEVVHLTVNGYLTTSGRALPVDTESSTFLAGWSPDMSYWLSDVLEASGPPTLWVSEEHHPERRWRLADESVP
ncbi:MAG: hypothetical protein ABSG36_17840 [Acidimicrobiales bacterium]